MKKLSATDDTDSHGLETLELSVSIGVYPWTKKRFFRRFSRSRLRTMKALPLEERLFVDPRVYSDVEEADHHFFPALFAPANFGCGVGVGWVVR